jgi:magnesium transporter
MDTQKGMRLFLPEVKELLKTKDYEALRSLLRDLLPPDIVELIELLPENLKLPLFELLDVKTACNVIEHMEPLVAISLLKLLPESKVITILNELVPDKRADLFSNLSEEDANHFLKLMEKEEAQDVEELLSYPPDTAGGLMTTQFAWIPSHLTSGEATEFLRKQKNDFEFYQVYVLKERKLLGVISLKDLITSSSDVLVTKIMHKIPSVSIDMDQERVVHFISKYNIPSIPVVDKNKKLQGIITVDDVVDVIKDEDTEDMQRFGGSAPLNRHYVDASILRIVKARLPWLIFLLFANFISGFVIQQYSELLKTMVSLVIFIPVLLACGGNAGMQAASVVIRGLATGEIRLNKVWIVVRKELLIGLLLGLGLGVLIAIRALPLGEGLIFGVAVGVSMVAGITIATVMGTLLPIIFEKLGFDPALMSGPLLTTIMDIAALVIYFGIAIHICSL